MGRAIDATGIQFKLLNRSRGPAVWSPRAQADKRAYSRWMRDALRRAAADLVGRRAGLGDRGGWRAGARCSARRAAAGIASRVVVLTTGTFLDGVIHVGREQRSAGRLDEPASRALAESLRALGIRTRRLKTGTPPRVHRASLDATRLRRERGRRASGAVLVLHRATIARQPGCVFQHTNDAGDPRDRARRDRRVAALQRPDFRDRAALLPVARRQGHAIRRARVAPGRARARGRGRRRDLRERPVDVPSARGAGGGDSIAAGLGGCARPSARVCGRVRRRLGVGTR